METPSKLQVHLSGERPKPTSNMEFVYDIMNFSPYGGLCQAFIIEAIRYYSEAVLKSTPKDDPGAAINPLAWYGVAKDINKRLKDQYEKD